MFNASDFEIHSITETDRETISISPVVSPLTSPLVRLDSFHSIDNNNQMSYNISPLSLDQPDISYQRSNLSNSFATKPPIHMNHPHMSFHYNSLPTATNNVIPPLHSSLPPNMNVRYSPSMNHSNGNQLHSQVNGIQPSLSFPSSFRSSSSIESNPHPKPIGSLTEVRKSDIFEDNINSIFPITGHSSKNILDYEECIFFTIENRNIDDFVKSLYDYKRSYSFLDITVYNILKTSRNSILEQYGVICEDAYSITNPFYSYLCVSIKIRRSVFSQSLMMISSLDNRKCITDHDSKIYNSNTVNALKKRLTAEYISDHYYGNQFNIDAFTNMSRFILDNLLLNISDYFSSPHKKRERTIIDECVFLNMCAFGTYCKSYDAIKSNYDLLVTTSYIYKL